MGTHLVVGLISDDEITKAKGSPPVMPYEERVISLKACKFVDEVIPYVPAVCCEPVGVLRLTIRSCQQRPL